MDAFPTEIIEKILGNLDAVTLIRNCSLVCRRWSSIIFSAPWKVLQKYRYEEIIVSEVGSFHVKFEKLANPYKQLRDIENLSRRTRSTNFKIASFDEAAKRMQYISCERLTFEGLSGENFLRVLKDYTKLCIDTKIMSFEFCNFINIEGNILISFFKPRKNKLNEISLDTCRNMNNCLSPDEFLDAIGKLNLPPATYRLRDQYTNSPWQNRLAEIILDTQNVYIFDMDGVRPDITKIKDRLFRWLCPWEAIKKTGRPAIDLSSLNPLLRYPLIMSFNNGRSQRLYPGWKNAGDIIPYRTEAIFNGIRYHEYDKNWWKKHVNVVKVLESNLQNKFSSVEVKDRLGIRFGLRLYR